MSRRLSLLVKLREHVHDIGHQHVERRQICGWLNAKNDVCRQSARQKVESGKLAKSPLQAVSRHSRLFVLRNDEANTHSAADRFRGFTPDMHERGSCYPDLEVLGPNALPLSCNTLKLCTTRDACLPRKSKRRRRRLTLLRTCPGFGPSAACAPSSGGEPTWHVPTVSPYAHGIHAS